MNTAPCRKTGFTLLEVLFSILVFSIGMLAYFTYQSRAAAMLFESESAEIAARLALEIPEEVNSLTEESFRTIVEAAGDLPTSWMSDSDLKSISNGLLQFRPGPYFDSFGNPSNNSGYFERQVRITSFNALTGSDYSDLDPHGALRVVEVWVRWPTRANTSGQCNGGPDDAACHHVITRAIKAIHYY